MNYQNRSTNSDPDDPMTTATTLDQWEAEADVFARTFIREHSVRLQYKNAVRACAEAIYQAVCAGEMSAREGAIRAAAHRNSLMSLARANSTMLGRSYAEFLKDHGRSIEELLEKNAMRQFSTSFKRLAPQHRDMVYLDVIRSSGRTNAAVDRWLPKANRLGQGLYAFSLFQSYQHVVQSRDKFEAFVNEATDHISAFFGGSVGAASARLLVGPGAPVFVAAGMFLGAFIAPEIAHKHIRPHFDTTN